MKPSTILFLIVFLIFVALTAGVGVLAMRAMKEKAKPEAKVAKSIPVHVMEVGTGDVEDIVYVTGFVEPYDKVDVYAKIPMPGKLIKAKVKKGDRVRKDQVIATVDRDEVGAIYLAYGVKATASGVIAAIEDDPGAMVAPQKSFATIIDIDKVKIETSILEIDLGRIKEGTKARVRTDAYPDRVFEGTITRISEVLDQYSHTATAEITVSNADHALLPSMFARIELIADKKTGVVVLPNGTVMKRQGLDRAYVVKYDEKDNALRISLTDLKLGYYDLEKYEVISGVSAGDLVVDRDLVVLKDQTLVLIEDPPKDWKDPTGGEGVVKEASTADTGSRTKEDMAGDQAAP